MNIPRSLIEKYAISGPRYTSYPTAVEFSDRVNAARWNLAIEDDIANRNNPFPGSIPQALSLYFHIPFCFQLCYFCACHKIVPKNRDLVKPYLAALKSEIEQYARLWPNTTAIEQIHWGGGSPDYLTPEETLWLSNCYRQEFSNVADDADISIEVDPRTTSTEHMQAYTQAGFNRISLGVQDFNEEVQLCINRIQPIETTMRVINDARCLGFDGVNIDLLYGLPKQTESSFDKTLDQVIEIKPDRIALYGYAHVTWLKKVQKVLEKSNLPSPEERITLFLLALQKLCAAGYEYIGMDHFALPQDRLSQALNDETLNRNFMGYTTHRGARIVGIGASSISSLPTGYAQNEKDVTKYLDICQDNKLPIIRGVLRNQDDCLRAEIIEQILCSGILDIKSIEENWQIDFWQYFDNAKAPLESMAEDGLIELQQSEFRLSKVGRVLARNVAMVFDAYLPKYRERKQKTFSQTV